MYCDELGCFSSASRVVTDKNGSDKVQCEQCFTKKKLDKESRISVEFCMWLQDTQVFDMFVNHLNKGIKIEMLNKQKAKGAGK